MSKTLRIVAREYKASVKTKGFIIGLIIAPLFMGGSLIAFALLKDRVDVTDKKVAVVDRTGQIASHLLNAAKERNEKEVFDGEKGKKVKPAYLLEVIESDRENPQVQRLELSDRVRNGQIHAFLDIGARVVHPGEDQNASRIAYYARNAVMDDLRGWLVWPINDRLRKLRLDDAGIEESSVKDLFYWVNVDGLGLVSMDAATGEVQDARRASEVEAILVPIILMMLMFLMIMMSVPGQLHSVMEEKTQRIAEVLLGSVKPFQFMMGKVLAGLAVSLTSAAIYIVCGTIAVRKMGYAEIVPFQILPWFFIYMILAIIMFGAWAAALGSTCSEPKDSQSMMLPVMFPIIIPMFVYFPVVKEPLGSFATTLSLIPLFTPLLMLLRQAAPGGVPIWQPLAGLAGVLLLTLFFVWAGARIFRVAILMQGTPPNLKNIVHWIFRG